MSEEFPELMTVKETSEYLRVPLPTVYYYIKNGQIPAVQIGGRWRVRRSEVDRVVLKNKDEPALPCALVIDDELPLQELFKHYLKMVGFSFEVVGNGKSAVEAMRSRKFDFVFLDLKLPDIPGDEVYMRLKEIDEDVPVVVITGYPDSEILSRILTKGPVMVVQKPIQFDQLRKVMRLLGQKPPEAGLSSTSGQ